MKCPFCASAETKVVDKRPAEEGIATRRRRECLECSKRFTTYERVETVNIIVIKKDGRKEPFDISKVERGILKACEKRDISLDLMKEMIRDIDMQVKTQDTTEIPSSTIGKLIMAKLKKLDKIAYIRFASVYKEFKDMEEFQDELKRLAK